MDLSKLSDDELLALKAGDYSKLSNESLMALKQQQAPQQSLTPLQTIGAAAGYAGEQFKNFPAYKYTPTGAGYRLNEMVNKGANLAGEMTTEKLGGMGVNPYVSAAAGTAVSMAPDIMQATMMPAGELAAPKIGQNLAQEAGMKSVGFTKRFLNTPGKLENAKNTAQTLLDQGAITPFASTKNMAERISGIAEKSGSRIGEILKTADPQGRFFDTKKAVSSLEELRPVGESGEVLTGGHYSKLNKQIDDAIDTIKAHGGGKISLDSANKIKGILQSGVAWEGRGSQNLMDRLIAGKFRESVDSQLNDATALLDKNALPGPGSSNALPLSQEFQIQKKLYAASQRAEDPIYNRISSELGNKKIGLTDWIALAPHLATGDPATALATLIGKNALERFGPQTTAYLANKVAKARIPISPKVASAADSAIPQNQQISNPIPAFIAALLAQRKKESQ